MVKYLANRSMTLLPVVLTAAYATAAFGQTSPDGATNQRPAAGTLDEIVVTAQRREERLQDVPISVAAVTSERLRDRGINDLHALGSIVPGLEFNFTANNASIYLRGVGENGGTPNNEASVATYIDGVYIAAPFTTVNQFNNIARVEVLKGPQGTLFGRNATGGVIQIVTRDPSQEAGGEISAGYGNYDSVSGDVYVTAPLTSTVAADFSMQYRQQFDGFGKNLTTGKDSGNGSSFGVRSKLMFTPNDRLTVRLAGDYNRGFSQRPAFILPKGVLGVNGLPTSGSFDTSTNYSPSSRYRNGGGSLRLDYEADSVLLTSISAYRVAKTRGIYDADATALDLIDADLSAKQHNISQEFQISSVKGSAVQWLVGAFYYNSLVGYAPGILSGLAISGSGVPFVSYDTRQRTKSVSGYGQATAEVVDHLKLTAGLRYTSERQKSYGTLSTIFGTNALPSYKQSAEKLTWRLVADYEFSRDIHSYISYNRGFKSGGFNILVPGVPGYSPETLDAFEFGFKSELADRRIRLNIAAFHYSYKDLQLTTVNQSTGYVANAARARINGIEGDMQVIATDQLSLHASLSMLRGKYLDYPAAPYFNASPLDPGPAVIDASGNTTVYSPRFTGNVGFEYRVPLAGGEVALSADLSHNSGYFFSPDEQFRQPRYNTLSAALRWQSADQRYIIRLWGSNLTNAYYFAQGTGSAFGHLGTRADPRTYGITGTTKF